MEDRTREISILADSLGIRSRPSQFPKKLHQSHGVFAQKDKSTGQTSLTFSMHRGHAGKYSFKQT